LRLQGGVATPLGCVLSACDDVPAARQFSAAGQGNRARLQGPRTQKEMPMSEFRPSPDLQMHYNVDDFTDPWRQPQTILMLHGNAESGLAWYAWVPKLARQYRVVRPDMRGFGQSTPMPPDHAWTLDELTADFC